MNLNAIGLGPIVPERLPGRGSTESPLTTDRTTEASDAGRRGDTATLTGEAAAGGPRTDADARLWALLSRDERAFFLRHGMTGDATYDPGAPPSESAPGARLGVRIDMRI